LLNFPEVPIWWKNGNKFKYMETGFVPPDYIVGYDTETCNGRIITQQFYHSRYGRKERIDRIEFVNDNNILDNFLNYISKMKGHVIVYCFNAKFDMAILMRRWISEFLGDDFEKSYKGFHFKIFCSRNWYGYIFGSNVTVSFLDIKNYFFGSLDSVGKSFNLQKSKLNKPDGLGDKLFTSKDKHFVSYALHDAKMCLEIGEYIIDMHREFDIPLSTSSANFAEKVFRRRFLDPNMQIQYPSDFSCSRLAEISYHGGKNGYYLETPAIIERCYSYDFNSAYPSAMFNIPSFLSGHYQHINYFSDKYVGIYQVSGNIKSCPYGILFSNSFQYFRYYKGKISCCCTSYELEEALKSKEFKLDAVSGWIWKPSTNIDNPLKEYSKYFWEKKNTTPKTDVRYLFYKLLLNSLYGKWIQRNPSSTAKYIYTKNQLSYIPRKDEAGGLYQPFIASLITGYVRAKLHNAEHYFSAIESSTDSVKSRLYVKSHDGLRQLGAMQLESFDCKECKTKNKSFTGLFLRNRLNVLMDSKHHVLKAALHGFWGKPEALINMYKKGDINYEVRRMPLIREGLKQTGKTLFSMYTERRSISIDWSKLIVVRRKDKLVS